MKSDFKELYIPDGLIVADEASFLCKVDRFKGLGATGLHCILDFDRTLTIKRPGTNDEVTTWHIMNEHLSDEAQGEYQQYFEKYRALELSGGMTQAHAVEWWSSILNLFVANAISLPQIEKSFLDKASVRPGTEELFGTLNSLGVPSTILSAGIGDIIEIWAAKYKIDPTLILSTKLKTDARGVVIDWDKSSLVHVLNKHETGHPELAKIVATRPNTIVVGDSMDDAAMAEGDEHVLRVRILDRRDDDPDLDIDKERTFERFDALVINGSMDPVKELVNLIADPSR